MPSEKRAKNIAEKKHVPHTGGGQYVRGESVKDLQRQKSTAQADATKREADEIEKERRKGKSHGKEAPKPERP
jgi:hypothetical protein